MSSSSTTTTNTKSMINRDLEEDVGEGGVVDNIKIMMGRTAQDVLNELHSKKKITSKQKTDLEYYLIIGYNGGNDRNIEFMLQAPQATTTGIEYEITGYLDTEVKNGHMDQTIQYYLTNVLRLNGNTEDNDDTLEITTSTTTTTGGGGGSNTRGSINTQSSTTTSSTTSTKTETIPKQHIQPRNRNDYFNSDDNIVQRLGNWQGSETITNGDYIHNGIWGYYEETTQREYALACTSRGIHIVDVTDPIGTGMIPIQFIEMDGGTIWRDVVTYKHEATGITYAYIAGQNAADLHIINLSALSTLPTTDDDVIDVETRSQQQQNHFDEYSNPIPSSDYKVVYGYNNYGHTIHGSSDGYLFLNTASWYIGIAILDLVSDPWNPIQIATYDGGDGHDCTYMLNSGYLYSADGYNSAWSIIDMSTIRTLYYNNNNGNNIVNLNNYKLSSSTVSNTYAHSNTLTKDGNYMYVFDEFNQINMGIYDISDPNNMIYKGSFSWIDQDRYNSLVHNGHVRGNLLHVAYYAAGYRVFDISNPELPIEVGYYDTMRLGKHRTNDLYTTYIGAWNCYVDLPSGNILVSDMVRGLYVFSIKE